MICPCGKDHEKQKQCNISLDGTWRCLEDVGHEGYHRSYTSGNEDFQFTDEGDYWKVDYDLTNESPITRKWTPTL